MAKTEGAAVTWAGDVLPDGWMKTKPVAANSE